MKTIPHKDFPRSAKLAYGLTHFLYIFIFIVLIKNAGLAELRELGGRERHTRNVGGGSEEIRRKRTRFRYFGVRIAHRWSRASDLPHDSFFSSDESFHSHARTAALTQVRIIDPSAARENIQCSVTSIRAYYAVEKIILSRKSNGNRVREIYIFLISLSGKSISNPPQSWFHTVPINVRKYYVCERST